MLKSFQKVPDKSIRTIHTSPPYNIKKHYKGYDDKLEKKEYLDFIEKVLAESMRTLVPGGSLFWQTGYTSESNSYIIPLDHLTYPLFQKLDFCLKDRIIWRYWGGMAFKSKFTNKHETILWWVKPGRGNAKTKSYDARNNLFGRNPGNVWEVERVAFGSNDQTSHIAVFPEEISDRIILSTTDESDVVLDPMCGSGTLCKVAKARGRTFIGFEISPTYHRDSMRRVSKQAKGEFLSVLSEIIKENIFENGHTKSLETIKEKLKSLLYPLSIKAYEKIIKKNYLNALCSGNENGVKKTDKKTLWQDLDYILPPVGCDNDNKDPVGLISLVDRAYIRAYKLHKVYSSAMRFYYACRWIKQLQRSLQPKEQEGWNKIIYNLVNSEVGNYQIDKGHINLYSETNRQAIQEYVISKTNNDQNITPELFK